LNRAASRFRLVYFIAEHRMADLPDVAIDTVKAFTDVAGELLIHLFVFDAQLALDH
jgi:hypothetical protein